MGVTNNKCRESEYEREYFEIVKKDLTQGVKKIQETIYSQNSDSEPWHKYLLNKFTEYISKNKISDKTFELVIFYLNNMKESHEAKHIYNLTMFLTRNDESSFSPNKSWLSRNDLNKDEVLWKGTYFIFEDIENAMHPLSIFIDYLRFNLTMIYEQEFSKLTNDSNQTVKSDLIDEDKLEETEKVINNKIIENHHSISKLYKAIIEELKLFSVFITDAMIRFYEITDSTSQKLYEIFVEKMKDILIRKDLYRLCYRIKSKLIEEKKENFKESLVLYYNIKPHYLCICPYFAMDRGFKDLFLKKLSLDIVYLTKTVETIPFHKSIILLHGIIDCDSISQKIDMMYKIRNSILSEIDSFWEEIPLKSKYKQVDANNFISLFIYIIIKSQLCSIVVDIDLIDDFAGKNTKLSNKGYFFSLFHSSCEYIISNLTLDHLDNNIKEYNELVSSEMQKIKEDINNLLEITII